jgi:beta-glucosidase
MPGSNFSNSNSLWGPKLLEATGSKVQQSRLDDMVRRILASWYYLGQDKDYPPVLFHAWNNVGGGPDVQGEHKKIARAVARDGIILLKNEGGALPVRKPKSLAIVGYDAITNPDGPNACVDRACNNGTLAMGWGSGTAEYPVSSPSLPPLPFLTHI